MLHFFPWFKNLANELYMSREEWLTSQIGPAKQSIKWQNGIHTFFDRFQRKHKHGSQGIC